MKPLMVDRKNLWRPLRPLPDTGSGRFEAKLDRPSVIAGFALGLALALPALGTPAPLTAVVVAAGAFRLAQLRSRERAAADALCETVTARALSLDLARLAATDDPRAARWNAEWPTRAAALRRAEILMERATALPPLVDQRLGELTTAADRQEEAVEETASLIANMRQSMREVADQVDHLLQSSDQSASSILELGQSIDEVANNTASLHQRVDSSTSSVHEMGASIRQVATSAEQVQEIAENTAAAVSQMDRSIQEVSNNAIEAASLTERAHEGAGRGRSAVEATISDIERISSLTTDAMDRLDGLVKRISQIGSILGAIDEINDETNLLSLNAAIIAAQAGEQGKAFLVVANHVKTLARRTAASTQDIERLIEAIGEESGSAVEAMRAGIDAVAAGVERSRGAGEALESIQESCSEASERVAEIARATSEQSRNSKEVAQTTLQASTQIHQISEAIAEQRRASEAMLTDSESARASCLEVHRSTDEQRATSRHITAAIGAISEMIREIGTQTRNHAEASDSTNEAVLRLLDNARDAASNVPPIRALFDELTVAPSADGVEADGAAIEDSA